MSVILVVEDEPLVRMGTVGSLRDFGCTVLEAATADEAMSILGKSSDIEVLFTDIEMPGSINGLELAHYVRRHWPDTHIFISSGRTLPPKSALPAYARFIAKPYYQSDLAEIAGKKES